ncbi:MAG: hypothetical protein KBF45_05085 [Cyclobacteriaceae bacterium]|jgi:hypothetical protein|nr:hypothetical protein [Cyclobacteriaceae bacterium]
MKTLLVKSLSSLALFALVFLASCTDDSVKFNTEDSQNVENEATTDSYFEDADDMATIAVAADGSTASGARESSYGRQGIKPVDMRFNCATITFLFADNNSTTTPHGFITIDFGDGCTDAKGNVRKGKIIVEFTGKRFLPDSRIITTFQDYFINGVKIEGVRTVTNVTGSVEENPKFLIEVDNGKATWEDGTFATREVNRTREWIRANNPLEDQWIVDGTAAGTNRNGKTYQVEITKALVYKRECAISAKVFIAVEGTKVLSIDNKVITIDYGMGECDRVVTITINGQSKDVTVRGDI